MILDGLLYLWPSDQYLKRPDDCISFPCLNPLFRLMKTAGATPAKPSEAQGRCVLAKAPLRTSCSPVHCREWGTKTEVGIRVAFCAMSNKDPLSLSQKLHMLCQCPWNSASSFWGRGSQTPDLAQNTGWKWKTEQENERQTPHLVSKALL